MKAAALSHGPSRIYVLNASSEETITEAFAKFVFLTVNAGVSRAVPSLTLEFDVISSWRLPRATPSQRCIICGRSSRRAAL